MAWPDHFNEAVPAILLDALRDVAQPFPLSGFCKGEDLGEISTSLVEVVVEAAEQLWAYQRQDGISPLPVSDVLHRLGVSDLNSQFARNVQRSLEAAKDEITAHDKRAVAAIVARVKLRHKRDLRITKAPAEISSAQPAVQLGRPGEACYVLSKEKKPLTDGQQAVISRLLESGSEGMSKDALEAVRPSARRILKTLRKDPDWAKVILMPGQTNGRYRLKM